jgi:HD superfamily phosphodiesterase
MTFWTIVETMAGHDLNHIPQVERIAATLAA